MFPFDGIECVECAAAETTADSGFNGLRPEPPCLRFVSETQFDSGEKVESFFRLKTRTIPAKILPRLVQMPGRSESEAGEDAFVRCHVVSPDP